MEESLKFNSQVCTTEEQSQRLLDLGLKPKTADMSLTVVCGSEIAQWVGRLNNLENVKVNGIGIPNEEVENTPAWSLHRLLEMIPSEIKPINDYYSITFDQVVIQYECSYHDIDVLKSFGDSPCIYDNIVDCIEWLISEGYFNKEYLKQ